VHCNIQRLKPSVRQGKEKKGEQMQTENEIQELKQELETLTGFIADSGTEQ